MKHFGPQSRKTKTVLNQIGICYVKILGLRFKKELARFLIKIIPLKKFWSLDSDVFVGIDLSSKMATAQTNGSFLHAVKSTARLTHSDKGENKIRALVCSDIIHFGSG